MAKSKNTNEPAKTEKEEKPENEFDALSVLTVVKAAVAEEVGNFKLEVQTMVAEAVATADLTTAIDQDALVLRVIENLSLKKTEESPPAFSRMDAESCYNRCFDKALSIVMAGQSVNYVQQPKNCTALMKSVVKLANSMFNVVVEEFEIVT